MSEYIEVPYLHNRHDHNLPFGLYSAASYILSSLRVSVPQNWGNRRGVKTIEEKLGEKGGAPFG